AGRAAVGAGIPVGCAAASTLVSAAFVVTLAVVRFEGSAAAAGFGAGREAPEAATPGANETVTELSLALMLYFAGWRRSITTRVTSGVNCARRTSRTGSRLLAI